MVKFVTNQYYDDENEQFQDNKYIESFYNAICKSLKIENSEFNENNLIEIVTSLIFTVSALHEQVGGIMDFVNIKLDWWDNKFYKNKTDILQALKNDFVASAALVMLTELLMILNIKHVLLNDDDDKIINKYWKTE